MSDSRGTYLYSPLDQQARIDRTSGPTSKMSVSNSARQTRFIRATIATAHTLLYLSLALKRRQQEYYRRLSAVRLEGDWEGWTAYFLECVREAADDGVATAQRLFALLNRDRRRLLAHRAATIPAVRLWEALPSRSIVTLPTVTSLMQTSKPTAAKALAMLCDMKILHEISGRRRDRVYAYQAYLTALTGEGA